MLLLSSMGQFAGQGVPSRHARAIAEWTVSKANAIETTLAAILRLEFDRCIILSGWTASVARPILRCYLRIQR